jgi:hypothetical protein
MRDGADDYLADENSGNSRVSNHVVILAKTPARKVVWALCSRLFGAIDIEKVRITFLGYTLDCFVNSPPGVLISTHV